MFKIHVPVGTKSVLVGAHCFLIHPWFVALAWWKLYGFPYDPRLWCAFVVHDLGHWGAPDMDGPVGEAHVGWGAAVMQRWFGDTWGNFCRYHSRYYARKHNQPISRLCIADKLSVCLEPWWFYLPRVYLSGEVHEYLAYARGQVETVHGNDADSEYAKQSATARGWFCAMTAHLQKWVAETDAGVSHEPL